MALKLEPMTARLTEVAEHYDIHDCWPQRSIDIIAAAGCWKWVIPKKCGGAGLRGVELLEAYEAVARGCMATALILTQRDGACDLIAQGENEGLKQRLLRAYARAERFTSVGIAQLTTSYAGRKPAMQARRAGRGFVLDGVMPWVTAAEHCDEIVTGAVLPDGRQILACVSCEDPGVAVEPPMKLLAVGASATSRVRCRAVRIKPDDVIRGPADIAATMPAPVKPRVVSAVGLGLAGALHDRLTRTRLTPDLKQSLAPLRQAYKHLRTQLLTTAPATRHQPADADDLRIRVAVNELVTKMGLAYLTLSKGTGYCRPHPAERLLREALLFLVWSAGPETQLQTMRALIGPGLATLP